MYTPLCGPAASRPTSTGPCGSAASDFGQPRFNSSAPAESSTAIEFGEENGTTISSTPSPVRSPAAGSCDAVPLHGRLKRSTPAGEKPFTVVPAASTTVGALSCPSSSTIGALVPVTATGQPASS